VLTLGLIVPTGSSPAAKAGYRGNDPLPADIEGANMRLAADHRRLLGNGRCTRPVTLDCAFETICERCGFFETGLEFVPVLLRQRDHATQHHQPDRAELFTNLLHGIDTDP
jgi:hypothetical protein